LIPSPDFKLSDRAFVEPPCLKLSARETMILAFLEAELWSDFLILGDSASAEDDSSGEKNSTQEKSYKTNE
jgi:hypothetical protein